MRRLLMVFTALCCFTAHAAQAGTALDLGAAARMALERAPAFAAALAARDASLEDEKLGRAGLLPFIKGTGEFSHLEQKYSYTRPKSFLASDVVFNRFDIGVTLVQPLFRLDRWAAFAQGKLASGIGELKLSLAQQALLLQVAEAYTGILVAQEDVAAAKAQEQAVIQLREQAAAAFSVGTATVNDALEAESRLDLVRADRIQAENNLNIARARFESLIGSENSRLFPFLSHIEFARLQPDSGLHWRDTAIHHALSVLVAEKKLAIAKQEVAKSFGTALPGVDVIAGLDREKVTNDLFDTGSTVKTE